MNAKPKNWGNHFGGVLSMKEELGDHGKDILDLTQHYESSSTNVTQSLSEDDEVSKGDSFGDIEPMEVELTENMHFLGDTNIDYSKSFIDPVIKFKHILRNSIGRIIDRVANTVALLLREVQNRSSITKKKSSQTSVRTSYISKCIDADQLPEFCSYLNAWLSLPSRKRYTQRRLEYFLATHNRNFSLVLIDICKRFLAPNNPDLSQYLKLKGRAAAEQELICALKSNNGVMCFQRLFKNIRVDLKSSKSPDLKFAQQGLKHQDQCANLQLLTVKSELSISERLHAQFEAIKEDETKRSQLKLAFEYKLRNPFEDINDISRQFNVNKSTLASKVYRYEIKIKKKTSESYTQHKQFIDAL